MRESAYAAVFVTQSSLMGRMPRGRSVFTIGERRGRKEVGSLCMLNKFMPGDLIQQCFLSYFTRYFTMKITSLDILL